MHSIIIHKTKFERKIQLTDNITKTTKPVTCKQNIDENE